MIDKIKLRHLVFIITFLIVNTFVIGVIEPIFISSSVTEFVIAGIIIGIILILADFSVIKYAVKKISEVIE